MITGGSLDTCGICGTQQGQLRSLDGTVTPIDASMEAKQAFVSGYLVPARDQQLRPVRAECGKNHKPWHGYSCIVVWILKTQLTACLLVTQKQLIKNSSTKE